jgi:hypothetical protein
MPLFGPSSLTPLRGSVRMTWQARGPGGGPTALRGTTRTGPPVSPTHIWALTRIVASCMRMGPGTMGNVVNGEAPCAVDPRPRRRRRRRCRHRRRRCTPPRRPRRVRCRRPKAPPYTRMPTLQPRDGRPPLSKARWVDSLAWSSLRWLASSFRWRGCIEHCDRVRCETGREEHAGVGEEGRSRDVLDGESGWLSSSASTGWRALNARAPACQRSQV